MSIVRRSFLASAVLAATAFLAPAGGAADDGAVTRAEYEQLRDQLRLHNQRWASVGWEVSVTEARRRAAEQGRPVFLVVNTGNCLGFV